MECQIELKLRKAESFGPMKMLNLTLHVSAPSWSSFWTRLCSCKASALNLGPFPAKLPSMVVLPKLITPDNSFGSNLTSVEYYFMAKFTAVNLAMY